MGSQCLQYGGKQCQTCVGIRYGSLILIMLNLLDPRIVYIEHRNGVITASVQGRWIPENLRAMSSKACLAGSLRSLSAAALSLIVLWLTVSLAYAARPGRGSSSVAEETQSHPPQPAPGGDRQPCKDMTEEKATESTNTLRGACLHEHKSGPEAGSMDRNT